jgi:acetoacetyl-CoA synthetase
VDQLDVTFFGTSAPYILACMKEGVKPSPTYSLRQLRAIGSTGAPLPLEGFRWVYNQVKRDLMLGSASGGTDVCTAFILCNPLLPVRAGELQCRGLGAAIEAWDENGRPVFDQMGELILTEPFPSMPVFLWNDTDGSRLQASYFEKFPGVWCHGDWIEIDSQDGHCVIHGRSDSTLNRGGVRMGSAEFYSVVEDIPEIAEALVIDLSGLNREDRLVLFVALREDIVLDDNLRDRVNARLRARVSPRHVPDAIYSVPEIPHTLNGKKLEVPIKRILLGVSPEKAVSREAMSNPESLPYFIELAKKSF